jgi:dipeptidyl-peptidase-4
MKLLKTSVLAFSILAGLSLSGCSMTQNTPSALASSEIDTPLSLAQIYKDKEFKTQRSTYFKWLDDGTGYTVLEERES